MCKWKQYWIVQQKRVWKALPGICLLTVLLTVSLLILLKAMFFIEAADEEKQVAQIGIVGDLSDSYLGIGINVLMNMEGIKSLADIQLMEQNEALERFASGEISAYLLVPDGFIGSLLTGENKEIIYVTAEETKGIGGILVNELVGAISDMITTTQTNIYAVRTYLVENDRRAQVSEAVKDMNAAFIGAVLNRMGIYELQETGVCGRISMTGYLFSGILLFLVLLWGMNCVSLLVRREDSLQKILKTKGLGAGKQVTAELAAYSVLQGVSLCCVFVCVIGVKSALGLEIPEWDSLTGTKQLWFVCQWILVVVMVAAMQAFLYELVTNVVNGVLLQFLTAVSMAYLCGCIYPMSFFPKAVQQIAEYLPAGVALRYVQKGLTGQGIILEGLLLIGYTGVFVGLHIWRRQSRIAGE